MSRTMFGPSLVQQGSSLALPSLLLGANSFAGPDSIMNYPSGLLSRTQPDFTSRFMADRLPVPPGLSPFGLRPELHHHQHLHQHMHQHLMPNHPPHPSGSSSSSSIDSVSAAVASGNSGTAFGSAAASSLLHGMAGYSTLGAGSSPLSMPGSRHGESAMTLPSFLSLPLVGGPLGLPLTSGLSGAFQPKNDVNSVPSLAMSAVQDRLSAAPQSRSKKTGQWCTAHVRIAWEIHLNQQSQKHLQSDTQRNTSNSKANESNRLNDHLIHLQTGGEGTLSGHLESLYRLGVPMFGRSPYSAASARNTFSQLPFGGLGGSMHRFASQADSSAAGFIGAASDWMRLSKSSPFPCPPPPWLRLPEGTDREKDRERERERDREREKEKAGEKDDDTLRGKVSSAQEMIDSNRESVSRRSSGSGSGSSTRNDRARSRSPLRPGRKASSSRDSASSPGGASSSTHRPFSDRSESRETDHPRRHSHRSPASTSPGTTVDPTARTPPFPAGQIYPTVCSSEPGLFMPYLWTNPLDGDQLMRRLLGNVDDPLLMRADRLAHLDLMLGKIPGPFPPSAGFGLNFRYLPNPAGGGRLAKTGLASLMPPSPRLPFGDLSTSPIYKVMGDTHHQGFR